MSNNPRTIIYLRSVGTTTHGGAEHARNMQQQACMQAAILAGCPTRRDAQGEPQLLNSAPVIEPISGSDKTLRSILPTLQPQDCFVISTLAVLGDVPSKLVANLSKIVASGCKIIVADLAGLDIATIRQTALAFMPLEERYQRVSSELDGLYATRSEERATYAREIQKSLIDQLYRRGFDLSDLLTDPEGNKPKPPVDDIRGRRLRQLREGLELSAEEAGRLTEALGEKALNKQYVSAIETGKDTTERADLYETALNAERGRRKVQAKLDQAVAKQSAHGQPPTSVELQLFGPQEASHA
ncbi:transcriptional regulator with XRE-family HTH domain [Sinorhizobium fredii]|uniref:hypothetical protein n=1 Tax=Rhizobium fredii TaxID=380 RepID=UPI0035152E19